MPKPDKGTVIQRLQELLQQAQNFERLGSDFHRTADFANWKSDVDSWLRAGSPHTDDQYSDFLNLRFEPIAYTSTSYRHDAEERWRRDLKRARHTIERAIENIQRDWTIPDGSAATATNPTPGGPTFINLNIQQTSLTVRAALEEIASAMEAKDQAEGTSFKNKIEKWAENPVVKTVLEAGLGAVLKRYAP
jgi:hypothetical protein